MTIAAIKDDYFGKISGKKHILHYTFKGEMLIATISTTLFQISSESMLYSYAVSNYPQLQTTALKEHC